MDEILSWWREAEEDKQTFDEANMASFGCQA